MRIKSVLMAAAAASLIPLTAPAATVFYSDNFDTNTAANYTITQDPDALATFNYDYSAMGIPSAPNSVGGTTTGVQFKANHGDETTGAQAINISPTGQSFTGDYILKFDAWLNQNGPFPAGGAGSTEFVTGGVGTTGTSVQKSGTGNGTGAWFAVDGEGGSVADFRAYSAGSLAAADSGVYAAGTSTDSRDNNNAYYHATFPGGAEAPQFQKDNYAQQTGALDVGTVGFEWREFQVVKIGDDVTWLLDGLPIATLSDQTFAGDNISVGYWDVFASISDNADLSFGVIDNLQVSEVPEPASLSLLGLAGLAMLRRRRQA